MPIRYETLLNDQILHCRFWGIMDDDLLMEYYDEMLNKGYLGKFRKELVDSREVTQMLVTKEGEMRLEARAQKIQDQLRGHRLAMVAATDIIYGMFRMWEMRREYLDYEVKVFRDFDEGLHWLKTE